MRFVEIQKVYEIYRVICPSYIGRCFLCNICVFTLKHCLVFIQSHCDRPEVSIAHNEYQIVWRLNYISTIFQIYIYPRNKMNHQLRNKWVLNPPVVSCVFQHLCVNPPDQTGLSITQHRIIFAPGGIYL